MSTVASLRAIAEARRSYLAVWAAVQLWDILATMPDERRYIWNSRWTMLRVVYMLNRYGVAVLYLFVVASILTPMSPDLCARIYWTQPLLIVWALLTMSPVVTDTIILAMTLYRSISVKRRLGIHLPLLQRMAHDGLLAFVMITVVHIVTLVLYYHNDNAIKFSNVSAAVVIGSLCSSRLVLSFHERAKRTSKLSVPGGMLPPLPS
ncbi:hypothetical protein JCM10212_005536 [Sporobolomyces blumeae]